MAVRPSVEEVSTTLASLAKDVYAVLVKMQPWTSGGSSGPTAAATAAGGVQPALDAMAAAVHSMRSAIAAHLGKFLPGCSAVLATPIN